MQRLQVPVVSGVMYWRGNMVDGEGKEMLEGFGHEVVYVREKA